MSSGISEGEGGNGLRMVRHERVIRGSLLLSASIFLAPTVLTGQSPPETDEFQALLAEVMPTAQVFSEKNGEPPVFRAFRADPSSGAQTLVGYVFLTSDLPPEEFGYSAPIVVLVGIDLDGTITGTRVLSYRESIRRSWGDFLRLPGVQEQYAGKHIADPFMVGRDVDGISRATITMSAMSRGIRNAARRVGAVYLLPGEAAAPPPVASTPAPPLAQAEPETTQTRSTPPVTTDAVDPDPAALLVGAGPASDSTDEAVSEVATERVVEQDNALVRLSTGVVWSKVVPLLALFGVAMFAFLRKNTAARWLALAGTLVYLGFVDGGFLSISHLTAGITTDMSVYVSNLPLLLIVTFTVATTLLWGRVLCGFLCPFGALQDFLERVVPRRLQRKIPQRIHDRAIYLKYAILGVIVVLAVVASEVSVFQYFEPFGTVFFLSPSVVLWGIALVILLASALVPRFYCRYVCPLGAALGVASLASVFRIRRVDACYACKVCERSCPTGAIRGPNIDFKECVRCDVCEVKLITRAGVCRKLGTPEISTKRRRSR